MISEVKQMQPKRFSILMKSVIIALAVFGAGFYFYFVPRALRVIDELKLFTDKSLFPSIAAPKTPWQAIPRRR